MDFTREQELAVKERKKDILVSAGAGAGKTRVLVSRIAELITDPVSPLSADELLVMTFTNAAAQEMKERIVQELNTRLKKSPEDRYLRRQIRLIRQADISTVHSFCSRLLRIHFQEAGLDPSFRIGEEGEMLLLKNQAMEELLEDAYQSESPEFLALVEAFAPGKDDWILTDMIERLYQFSRGFPDAKGWFGEKLAEIRQMSSPEGLEGSEAAKQLQEKTGRALRMLKENFEKKIAMITGNGEEALPDRYAQLIQEDFQILNELEEASSFLQYYEKFHRLFVSELPRGVKKEEKNCGCLDEIKELHKEIREKLYGLRDQNYQHSPQQLSLENEKLLPWLQELVRLMFQYESRYLDLKREQNVYDFDDLEHMTLKLLIREYDEQGRPVPSETALMLSGKYKAIFVDEYQDTNMVQETILQILLGKRKNDLFAVGDVKQSIYRFRQARPDLFLSRQAAYEADDGSAGINIVLRDNFRSAPDVIKLCNKVFSMLMNREFGGVDYDEEIALRAGLGGPMQGYKEESEILLLLEDEEKTFQNWEYDPVFAESAMIAQRVRRLSEEGYRYKDIVILLRSGAGRAEEMAEYLKMMDIPAECESRRGYFHTREVGVILNYLSVIDNVYLDIPMASVLLSSIGGFSEEEVALLKTQIEIPMRKEYSLFELMELYVDTGDDPSLRGRYEQFLLTLSGFRKKKNEMPLHQLIWEIYQQTGFYYDVLLMKDGEKRRENLNMLLQKAEDYEKTVFKGLFYFVRYMDQLQSYEVELGEARTGEEADDKIHIMTIHKSKGLEFPVVFVSGLSRQFNFTDTNHPLLTHPVFGLGMEYVDVDVRIHHPSVMKGLLRDQIRKETLEEELRILYVAMTRAQKKLILTGVAGEKMLEKHRKNSLSYMEKTAARSYMDWILPIALKEEMAGYVKKIPLHQLEEILPEHSRTLEDSSYEDMLHQITLPEDCRIVKQAFSYEYPYMDSASWKRKYSVSELKKLSMMAPSEEIHRKDEPLSFLSKEDADIPVPDFLKEKQELAPAMRGTIVHKIMELLPFGKIQSKKELYDAIEHIRITYKEAEKVSIKQVYKGAEQFLFSPEGEQICQMDRTGRFYKEVPFTISIPASFVGNTFTEEENVIVQGIIDAYGEGQDGLWLIDYKTDHIRPDEEEVLLDRYQKQMLYYKTALEMLIRKPVKKIFIFSFATGHFIPVPV